MGLPFTSLSSREPRLLKNEDIGALASQWEMSEAFAPIARLLNMLSKKGTAWADRFLNTKLAIDDSTQLARCGDCNSSIDVSTNSSHACSTYIHVPSRARDRKKGIHFIQDGIIFRQVERYVGYMAWRYILEEM